MTIQEIKLMLIKKITESEDQQKLLHLLQLLDHPSVSIQDSASLNEQMMNVLLKAEKQASKTSSSASPQDIEEIQQSINELFQGE